MRKKNILVVDDDDIANFLIEKIVQSTGVAQTIRKAVNGKEALEVLNSSGSGSDFFPEVILLDLNMPIMNGFEFLQAFDSLSLERKNTILIILVTSSNNPSDMERARRHGVRYYLTKPISAETIMGIFRQEFNQALN